MLFVMFLAFYLGVAALTAAALGRWLVTSYRFGFDDHDSAIVAIVWPLTVPFMVIYFPLKWLSSKM
jgi:hypothetical protein